MFLTGHHRWWSLLIGYWRSATSYPRHKLSHCGLQLGYSSSHHIHSVTIWSQPVPLGGSCKQSRRMETHLSATYRITWSPGDTRTTPPNNQLKSYQLHIVDGLHMCRPVWQRLIAFPINCITVLTNSNRTFYCDHVLWCKSFGKKKVISSQVGKVERLQVSFCQTRSQFVWISKNH